MGKRPKVELITEERIERALVYLAYIIEQHGEVYLPLFERLERELADLSHKEATLNRARTLLAQARTEGKVSF